MYNNPNMYPYPYSNNAPMYNAHNMQLCPYIMNAPLYHAGWWNQFPNPYLPSNPHTNSGTPIALKDYGPNPFVINIAEAANQNSNFRTALWTGKHLQLTLMSLKVGEDIGLEQHPHLDQFIRIEEGQGLVKMGDSKDKLDFQRNVYDGYVFIIPAGKWHNLINTGDRPLKLYSIYAPPQHPHGTVHKTKEEALAAEEGHEH